MNKVSFPVVAALALLSAGPAVATVVYTGSGTAAGNPVSASAQFTFNRDLLTIFLSNTSEGIASAGYATTGFSQNIGNFNGNNLDDPASLDGINFGLVSSASGFTPNGGKNGKGGLKYDPLIQDSVTFVLDNVKGLAVSDISNVSFQYGTNISEGNIPGMPPSVSVSEPPSGYVFGLGALLLLFRFWIRKRNGADDVSESDDRLSDRGARKTSVFLQRSI
jgi:hypothetical protein